ncbi:MAG TPA: aldehyde dehydrogenase family protein [Candidatus Binataceae bacterium]|jgi:acyl-CoA reductase-like NAD-dependent aldehyde dehydrogenase|nr:aldehyde dehydrogenase family protein [Candidatus Binataceae bacterium]
MAGLSWVGRWILFSLHPALLIGVVGLITPWNFPIAIPAWKIAPALAYGNCVILKPADLVPATAHALADIIVRAGIPLGVFNLVMGRGSTVGQALLENKDVAAISFTGSVATGRRIYTSGSVSSPALTFGNGAAAGGLATTIAVELGEHFAFDPEVFWHVFLHMSGTG